MSRSSRRPLKRGRPQAFTFTYKAPTKQFAFSLSFKKADVEPDEVIETLERILDDLRTQRAAGATDDQQDVVDFD